METKVFIMNSRQTKFSDVCGTMDELKRLLYEEYEKVSFKPKNFIKPLLEDALFMLGRMKERLQEYKDFRKKIGEAAEAIRAVAGTQEGGLRSYKDLSLKVYDYFREICGDRAWLISQTESRSFMERVRKKYQAWLPPQPHCDKLLERLKNSGAYVLKEIEVGEEPVVQFEDGGSIPMSQVRYDPNIKNFHPSSFKPASTGRKYRGR
jgi:hypothetical protein